MPPITITWEVTIDQVQAVLILLGKNPYEQVHELIGYLRDSANRQIEVARAQQQQVPARTNGEARAAA
jgi:hypothetical protein